MGLHSYMVVMWHFVWEGWTYWAEDFLPVHIILYNSNRSIASSCHGRMPVWPNPCFLVASWSNLVGFLTWVQYHACAPRAVVLSCFLVLHKGWCRAQPCQLSTCQVRCLRLYISYLAGLQLILFGFRLPMGWKGTATPFRLDFLDSDSSTLQTYVENGFLHSGTTRTGLQRSLSGRN